MKEYFQKKNIKVKLRIVISDILNSECNEAFSFCNFSLFFFLPRNDCKIRINIANKITKNPATNV